MQTQKVPVRRKLLEHVSGIRCVLTFWITCGHLTQWPRPSRDPFGAKLPWSPRVLRLP